MSNRSFFSIILDFFFELETSTLFFDFPFYFNQSGQTKEMFFPRLKLIRAKISRGLFATVRHEIKLILVCTTKSER